MEFISHKTKPKERGESTGFPTSAGAPNTAPGRTTSMPSIPQLTLRILDFI
jgi:hypothetical protein